VERSKITTYRLAYDLTGNRHDAVPALKDFAKTGRDKHVRSMAVNALGQIGTEKAKAALMELLGMNPKE